jgi:hypothetical protein
MAIGKEDFENAAAFAIGLVAMKKGRLKSGDRFCLNCCWGSLGQDPRMVVHRYYECTQVPPIDEEPAIGQICTLTDSTPYNIWFGMFPSLDIVTAFAYLIRAYLLLHKKENVPLRGHCGFAGEKGKICLDDTERKYIEEVRI